MERIASRCGRSVRWLKPKDVPPELQANHAWREHLLTISRETSDGYYLRSTPGSMPVDTVERVLVMSDSDGRSTILSIGQGPGERQALQATASGALVTIYSLRQRNDSWCESVMCDV